MNDPKPIPENDFAVNFENSSGSISGSMPQPYPLLIPSDIHVEVAFEIHPNVIQYTLQG